MTSIRFRRVTEDDFPLLAYWLARPHVARWWHQEHTAEAVARDFGPAARREEPSEDFLALRVGTPFALLQRARWHDYPEYVEEIAPALTVPPEALTIDYFIGRAELTGRGIGTDMIRTAVADIWTAYPAADCVIVPVAAGNRPSWRALEKAGFTFVTLADLAPDNPIDPREHRVYRLDRP